MKTSLLLCAFMTLVACAHSPDAATPRLAETPELPRQIDRIEVLPCVWVLYQPSLVFVLGCRKGVES